MEGNTGGAQCRARRVRKQRGERRLPGGPGEEFEFELCLTSTGQCREGFRLGRDLLRSGL